MIHELKTWPAPFRAVVSNEKPFEVRRNDRDFAVGDTLRLREFDPSTETYSGQEAERRITYILQGGQFGIEAGFVVLGIKTMTTAHSIGKSIIVVCDFARDPDISKIAALVLEQHQISVRDHFTILDRIPTPMPALRLPLKKEKTEKSSEPWRKGRPLR